jgi:stage III sporulation protein AE
MKNKAKSGAATGAVLIKHSKDMKSKAGGGAAFSGGNIAASAKAAAGGYAAALQSYGRDKKKLRRLFLTLFIFIGLYIICTSISAIFGEGLFGAADNGAQGLIEKEIGEKIDEQLSSLDTTEIQRFIDSLSENEYELFGSKSFKDIVSAIISGDFKTGYGSFFGAIASLLLKETVKIMPTLSAIAAVAVLCGILSQMRPAFLSKSTGEIVYFVCYGAIILLVMNGIMQLIAIGSNALGSMKAQMNISFPILLTLMAAIGGTVSVTVYQPAVALLVGGITEIVTGIIFPLFIIATVFSVVGNLSDSVKLTKMTDFFKSSSTWIIGIVFTIFVSFLTIKGITAASYDGISIRAAKFAAKTYIPILGGYLSDGFDLILASTVLVKNAVGLVGIYLLIATILAPIIQILVFMMGLKLVSAIIEPITDKRISDFVHSVSKNITILIAAIIAVSFMYLITVMLIVFTSNALI